MELIFATEQNFLEFKKINGIDSNIIHCFLAYTPTSCIYCGTKNESSNDIIKWSYKRNCKVKIPKIVDYLLNTNSLLKDTYDIYQNIIISLQNKDKDLFLTTIHSKYNNISDYMKKSIKTYNSFEKYILNSFDYDLNNGIIEGTNNLIKVIKKISF